MTEPRVCIRVSYGEFYFGNATTPAPLLPVPYRVENGELVLPSREELLELVERTKPANARVVNLSLYVRYVQSITRMGPSVAVLDFDYVSIECCCELRVFDARVPFESITFDGCNELRVVRAHCRDRLALFNNYRLVCVDTLEAPGTVVVDKCNALAFVRGLDRARHLTVFGKRDRRSAPLYIAGDRFERLESKPGIFERVVAAVPRVSNDLWRDTSGFFVDGEPRVDMWYTVARRKMDERTWLTLAWRAMTGDTNVTGLAHADLLRTAMRFL